MLKKKRLGLQQRNGYENVLKEIRILKRLNHPNIVRLYEVIDDASSDYIYLVMEYVSGESLMQNSSIPEEKLKKYFADIVDGLDYCMSCLLSEVVYKLISIST